MAPQTSRYAWWLLIAGIMLSVGIILKLTFEKRTLVSAYAQTQAVLRLLEHESAQLSEELGQVHPMLETQVVDLNVLRTELAMARGLLAQAEGELVELRNVNTDLAGQLASTTNENQQLLARLSSLEELRTAIRTVKRRIRQVRWGAWQARRESQRFADQAELAKGNRGYWVRNGIPTLGGSSRLQVRVLAPHLQ